MGESTLKQLRDQAKRRVDQAASAFVSKEELNGYVNDGLSELYDILVSCYRDYYREQTDIEISGLTQEYDIPNDLYKLLAVFYAEGTGDNRDRWELEPFMLGEFSDYNNWNAIPAAAGQHLRYRLIGKKLWFSPRPQVAGGVFEVWYIPMFKPLVDDDQTVGHQIANGWEEFVVTEAASHIAMKAGQQERLANLEAKSQQLRNRIQTMAAQRDAGKPQRIRDVYNWRNNYQRRRRLY